MIEKAKEPEVVEGKRVRTQRNVFNAGEQGSNLAAMETDRTVGDDGLGSGVNTDSETAPESFSDAVKDQRWRDSMQAEIKALKNRGVWRVIPVPDGIRLIKSKYVYRVKKNWLGKIIKRKSRLVVQGFSQVEGVDYDQTFAPVAKVTTFRLLLALSKVLKLQIHQLDVDSAFLYADLDEDVFMTPPPGMDIKQG